MEDATPNLAEFPNTVERRRESRAGPDTMADQPTQAIKPSGNDSSVDPDTCRICRGEGTADEPLFYPCKCSGSIKYVHQDCLMEWLSHSQKKHCELCKTPFRFTKLYSPDMPKRLPLYIFVTHMAKYLFRSVLVWLRALLVISVWLGWLPYLMRSVWSFLFWISDEGFGSNPPLFGPRNATSIGRGNNLASFTITGTTTCASSPLLAAATTAATLGGAGQISVTSLLRVFSNPLNTTPPSWFAALLGVPNPAGKPTLDANDLNLTQANHSTMTSPAAIRPSSLLSDVAVLKNLTRHPAINRTVIAVLEGQIITLLVIVCFILIILVRDYVVQQQPEINMRAAFAAAENDAPPPTGPVDDVAPRDPDSEEDSDVDSYDDSIDNWDSSAGADNGEQEQVGRVDNARDAIGPQNPRPIAEIRRRRGTRPDFGEERRLVDRGRTESFVRDNDGAEQDEGIQAGPSHQNILDLDHSSNPEGGADMDGGGGSTSQSTVKEYLRIYREAGGDREKILQIIRNEGLEDRMSYWIQVTQSMGTAGTSKTDLVSVDVEGPVTARHDRRSSRSVVGSDSPVVGKTGSDTSSWTWAETDDGDDADAASPTSGGKGKGKDKGKAPEVPAKASTPWAPWGGDFGNVPSQSPDSNDEDSDNDNVPSSQMPGVTRPRSVSDGPQAPKAINILANNNWSFSYVPPDTPDVLDDHGTNPPNCHAESTSHPTPAPSSDSEVEQSGPIFRPGALARSDIEAGIHVGQNAPGSEDDVEVDNPSAAAEHVQDAETARPVVRQPGGIVDRVTDFMWGDVEAVHPDDVEPEEAVDIFADNRNVPFFDNDGDGERVGEDEVEMAPDVVEAAVAAGLDPEAVDDAEDFEGIMELIGMRGPVAGLFQNAIFCAFLVSISIFLCVFVPYNVGRVSVWIIANPTRLLRIVFSISKFVQDAVLLAVGYTCTMAFTLAEAVRLLFRIEHGKQLMRNLRTDARHVASDAFDRILTSFLSEMPLISVSEVRNFSAISHEALVLVKDDIRYALSSVGHVVLFIFGGDYWNKLVAAKTFVSVAGPALLQLLRSIPGIVVQPGSWMLNLNISESPSSAFPELACWDANDRTWAILLGYTSLSVIAGLYLARGTPFSTSRTAQEWEASVIDALNQASGVMKVILIISIEMLIFPLYCGLLLDFALLPLFEGTSVKSRLLFTYNYPLTSIFVHWFVGTGYMFHFALFVSMCRKIMRKGVLYFIRDPDDPEFHPVRDVLERNVTTQLRKILFSAFVYGALVVVCLGGVVWGLSLTLPNVLPIHYSSNEPVLEFPIDLLFYNFLMPLAVKFFRPSDGLHAMYTWWFRKCARALRLTWFLFGERRVDEEGTLVLARDSPHRNQPWWSRVFLEINEDDEVGPKSWRDTFTGGKAKPASRIPVEEMALHNARKTKLVESGELVPNGRFVRSPASDQVKIPKGQSVFLDVSEQNTRNDGKLDQPEADLYSGHHYQFVYVPPWFRARTFLFILFIWMFAAVTGVGFTIVPLVFGRRMFQVLIPSHIRTNDIYAFSIGIYILGSLLYLVFHLQSVLGKLKIRAASTLDSILDRHAIQRILHFATRACRLLYTYAVLLIVFPLLITLLVELYLLMPLHTYMYPTGVETTGRLEGLREAHTIRVIQAWTLGILYLKLGSRALTLYGGRPAHAVRAVLRRGWLEPDVGVLTRAFVIPGVIASLFMIVTPPMMARVIILRLVDAGTELTHETRVLMFRLSYPLAALFWAGLMMTRRMLRVLQGWQVRIRDEAYLMGERLHNFGGTASKVSWKGSGRL
ncbi:hypothetical protein GGR54DRAFT_622933 [Hypoxylon sp. NC1633]|nr:hypothetical protein GGR54DRAFT_622933 [Hypoxylon sp. NC1633]